MFFIDVKTQIPQKPYQGGRRRTGVSAEPVGAMSSAPRERVVHQKTAEQKSIYKNIKIVIHCELHI